MNKQNFLTRMLLLFALIVGSVNGAWGATADVTYDVATNGSVSGKTLTVDGTSFNGEGTDNFKMNSGYFMMGKSGAYITFPTYAKDVEKIVVTGKSGASSSTIMNIYVGETAVSTETKGSTGVNTYEINSSYQAAGTVYTLKVTSNHNAQITKIEVFFKADDGKIATVTTIDGSGITNTDLRNGTSAGNLSATIKASGSPISGTVNWKSNNTDVVEVDGSGNVTLVGVGDAIISATYSGDATYNTSSGTYNIKVTDSNWIDYTAKGYADATDVTSETGIYGTVTFAKGTNSDGNAPKWYNNGSAVRFYAGNTITIKANDGYVLTGVNFHLTSSSMSTEDFDKDVTQVDKTNEFLLKDPAQQLIYTSPGKPRIDKIKLSIAEPIEVTSAGYATYVSDADLDYSGLTVKAYKALVSEKAITFTEVTTVPAGEGVLLQGAEGTYNVPVAASAVAAWADSDNAFVPGSDAPVASDNGDGKYNYVLSTDNNDVVGFYKAANKTVARNRAYLQSTTNAARLAFNFDDETGEATGISEMKNVKADAAIYNLNGVRVKNMTKGLYIMNGKKVIVK